MHPVGERATIRRMGKPAQSCLLFFGILFLVPFSYATAQISPKQIGYFCNPHSSTIAEGQYYLPQADPCVYLSSSLSFGPRVGDFYRGTVGSSTLITGHGIPAAGATSTQFGDVQSAKLQGLQQGEDVFVAIFRVFASFQEGIFRNYFRTGAGAPPHTDYGFIRFKWGTPPPPEPDTPEPVIIIPGILGSEKNNDGKWVIDPILHTYDDLIATLDANHYTPEVDLFTFPYNWRKSNVETALLLKEKIDAVKAICECEKVDLVAHSMGGLVARQYIQSDAYENDVDQLIFLGTPHLGAPKAYLMWEGGEVGPFGLRIDYLASSLLEAILSFEAHEYGYDNLFDYVRNEPITSVQQLLPTYNYMYDGDILRVYPQNYPANGFLEDLNAHITSLLNSGIEIHNIVGALPSQTSTIFGIDAENNPEHLPKWEHGYPKLFDAPLGSHGLILGEGDGTVPIASASFVNENRAIKSLNHQDLVTGSGADVFHILTGKAAAIPIESVGLVERIMQFKILSPADLLVIAPDGKKVGKENGTSVNEIPLAFYTGFNTETEYITILNPLDGEYRIFTEGTDTGAYTVETNFISDATTTESSFMGKTVSGLVTEFSLPFDTENPILEIEPVDTIAPTITIPSPQAQDYLRSETIVVDVTATDESGIYVLETYVDGILIPNKGVIDSFFQPLGNHTLFASTTDNVGNLATTSVSFRIIATLESTRSDVEHAFSLGWMVELVRNKLLDKLDTAIRKKAGGQKFDKFVAKDILNELERRRGNGLNEQAYRLLKEDVKWIISH